MGGRLPEVAKVAQLAVALIPLDKMFWGLEASARYSADWLLTDAYVVRAHGWSPLMLRKVDRASDGQTRVTLPPLAADDVRDAEQRTRAKVGGRVYRRTVATVDDADSGMGSLMCRVYVADDGRAALVNDGIAQLLGDPETLHQSAARGWLTDGHRVAVAPVTGRAVPGVRETFDAFARAGAYVAARGADADEGERASPAPVAAPAPAADPYAELIGPHAPAPVAATVTAPAPTTTDAGSKPADEAATGRPARARGKRKPAATA